MNEPQDPSNQQAAGDTLYRLATDAMRSYIRTYLELTKETKALGDVRPEHVTTFERKLILLGGINSSIDPASATETQVVQEWQRTQAIPFDVEPAITSGVYIQLRDRVDHLLAELDQATSGFSRFDPAYIAANPQMLPILQRLAGISSKAELRKRIGALSDNNISTPAALRLANLLNSHRSTERVNRGQILQSIEPTLEGIVRDLVGRVLLESVVADALTAAGIAFMREAEYDAIKGVVYDFRADFVIPDGNHPLAFVEVRKSSSRHASLYAKDKMFSAINLEG